MFQSKMESLEKLSHFLQQAPYSATEDRQIVQFSLGNNDRVSCVKWAGNHFITGTDIVKILVWRFQLMGRQIISTKKFEEGIFSDLRSLKAPQDASLEAPRSDFLDFLHRNGCVRTQKKQKVFFWSSVNHQRLFEDARDREIRRESNLLSISANGMNFFMNQHAMSPQTNSLANQQIQQHMLQQLQMQQQMQQKLQMQSRSPYSLSPSHKHSIEPFNSLRSTPKNITEAEIIYDSNTTGHEYACPVPQKANADLPLMESYAPNQYIAPVQSAFESVLNGINDSFNSWSGSYTPSVFSASSGKSLQNEKPNSLRSTSPSFDPYFGCTTPKGFEAEEFYINPSFLMQQQPNENAKSRNK